MGRISFLVWIMTAPTLMGIFVLTVLVVPELAQNESAYLLPAALLGAVLAMPVSYIIGKKMTALTKRPS